MAKMNRIYVLALAAAALVLGGCASLGDSPEQALMVRAVQDNREIGNVGCVLTNDAGRWFVTAPGHVSIRKSAGNLFVDCKKGNASVGQERFASRPNNMATIGNAVTTAGLGYLYDKRTGAGFEYPETLTVLMVPTGRAPDGPLRDEPQETELH
ncbi:hypothetical protein SAMN05428948_2957 [Massilia sp. CF038]|nr:hypothetical protein SAMN05428948_2957 [Massilia sp. CF038]